MNTLSIDARGFPVLSNRDYQYDFSANNAAMFDRVNRERKAETMVRVLREFLPQPLESLSLLNVGGSAGIIDNHLARFFGQVTGIDIDDQAIAHARENFSRENLSFEVGDAQALSFPDNHFDVVICSQVYEHVPDAHGMMRELYRVLKPGGVVYFAASNRLMWNEPHYDLPLLSVLPRFLAHGYVRLAGKGRFYHEKHFSYWGLRRLVRPFEVKDFTLKILQNPEGYGTDYMVPPGSLTQRLAVFLARYCIWLVPGYIWVLRKP